MSFSQPNTELHHLHDMWQDMHTDTWTCPAQATCFVYSIVCMLRSLRCCWNTCKVGLNLLRLSFAWTRFSIPSDSVQIVVEGLMLKKVSSLQFFGKCTQVKFRGSKLKFKYYTMRLDGFNHVNCKVLFPWTFELLNFSGIICNDNREIKWLPI